MKKNDELKQSKISRHQNAKDKFRHFQRSMSCKSLNTKADFIPGPGQFAILTNVNKKKVQGNSQLPLIHGSLKKSDNLQKDLKFTTNLKLITRQRSPSRVSQLLNDTVNKKIEQKRSLKKIIKSQSTGNLRPLTALSSQLATDLQGKNNLIQSRIITNAAQYDKKYYLKKQFSQGNTFMVKSKSTIPRHAYGHKSIRLTQEDNQKRLKIQPFEAKKFIRISINQKQQQQESDLGRPNFLPIEYYMIDDQKPEQLIQKYKLKQNYMVGYSKWQDLQGQFQWKKCRVIDYIKQKQRWQIEWLHNGKRKIVARNNLFFQKQNFENYQKIINEAEQFRAKSQIYLKYNWIIDNLKSETHKLQENQITRILRLVVLNRQSKQEKSIKTERALESLLREIKQKYIRANHIVQFNASLPFNQKNKQQFRGYLPANFFIPNASLSKFNLQKDLKKQIKSTQTLTTKEIDKIIDTSVHPSTQLKKYFQTNLKNFNQHTSLSSIHRINIIEFLNKAEYQIKNQRISSPLNINIFEKDLYPKNQLKFFTFYTYKLYSLSDIGSRIDNSLFQSVSKINNIVCQVQYSVAKQLDPLYLDKKAYGYEEFDNMIAIYRRFLSLVNMRVQNIGRQILFGTINQLSSLLLFDSKILDVTTPSQFYQILDLQKKIQQILKLKVKFQIKGENIECTPKKSQILFIFNNFVQKLITQFGNVSCIRKSYIDQLRPKNKMKIIQCLVQKNVSSEEDLSIEMSQWQIHRQLVSIRDKFNQSLSKCEQAYEQFYREIKRVFENIMTLQNQIKKKAIKKCSFSQIQQFLSSVKTAENNLQQLKYMSVNSNIINLKNNCDNSTNKQISLKQYQNLLSTEPKYVKIGIFHFNIEDLLTKIQSRLQDVSIQLYKLILQKISKQSEKLDKNIDSIIQKLEKQPLNIKQMINLQQYIQQQASQQLHKISSKINELHQRFTLLEKLNIEIQYKDFYECHKVYMKPMRIKAIMIERLKAIQSQYKKVFGQSLARQIGEQLTEIREIQQKFYSSIQINSIQQMDSSFVIFSKLKQRIQSAVAKTLQINQYQTAMKWISTNFMKLTEIKVEFLPYYQLMSLQKNFRFHIEAQLTQSLQSIDANKISQNVMNGCDQLSNLQTNVFFNNPIVLQIVKEVSVSYKNFREKLPLLQILRNSDLRQRHWLSIKQLTGFDDILSEKITFLELQQRDIKRYEKKLIQISHIATRQLIYEKRLNKMKKQWKEMKILMNKIDEHLDQNNNLNELKVITNLEQIQTKTENDIYQIQQILSSSFIKFLEKDILNWRNFTLYKMYEFVQIWKIIEKQITQMYQMFRKKSMRNDANTQYQKFKSLQKNWKNITNQIEQQPNILELLQTKINQSLKYTVELIEDLKKSITLFFEKKKQRFSRFGSLSQEQLIALFSNNDQKQIFDQAVRKCLHGVKNVVRNETKKITCVKTHLDQQITFKEGVESSGDDNQNMSPDRIIEDIEKRIKRSLRNSIQDVKGERSNKILQIILFHQRIIFTRQIENQLCNAQEDSQTGINQGYLSALLGLKSKIIEALFKEYEKVYQISQKNKKQQNLIKIQTQLNQLINNIETAQNLYNKNVKNIFDFEWLSQIRTYQKDSNYVIQIGLNRVEYGFQITDQQTFIMEENTARTFFHIAMATKQRMFSLLSGHIGTGKISIFHYLANIHGKNQYVLNCHKALSYENLFDFFRMAANGIWIIFNSLNLLSQQVFSCFRQSSQLFWANYPTIKNKSYFMLGDRNIAFSTHEIGMFGTINLTKSNSGFCNQITDKLSTYYRNFNILPLDVRYVLECKLVLAGFQYCSNTRKFLKMIETIKQECEKYYAQQKSQVFQVYQSLTFSKLNFIDKIISFAKQFKKIYQNQNIDDYLLLQLGLNKGIEEITKNLGNLKAQILQKLNKFFGFIVKLPLKINSLTENVDNNQLGTTNLSATEKGQQPLNESDELIKRNIKKLFLDKKLFSNRQIVNHYFEILKILKQKHSIIILGSCSTGKSQIIQLLSQNKILKQDRIQPTQNNQFTYVDDFKISLRYIHPNAYSLQQLHGDIQNNGIVNSLIKQGYEALEKAKNNKKDSTDSTTIPFNNVGIVFDSEIRDWIQPLLPIIKNAQSYVQPNGKNMIIQHPIKLIFECRDLSCVSPSIILSTNIVHLQDYQLKWQNIFTNYIKKHFKAYYQKRAFLDFCEHLVIFIMEPVLQFFKNSISNLTSKIPSSHQGPSESDFTLQIYNTFLKNQINYIPLIFNLFIALIENYFSGRKQSQNSRNTSNISETHSEIFSNNLDDKQRSAVLNIFLMSITWTIGLFIPQQSKKTFSRHFKYLIKRAVQLNIKGIQKDCLPKDQEDIYDICFVNLKWQKWEDIRLKTSSSENYNHRQSQLSQKKLQLKYQTKYLYFLDIYCESQLPFFIMGKTSTGKNSLMLQFLNSRSNEIYNKVLISCTANSSHQSAKRQLKKQIAKEKYSHTFKGFVHGKITMFYLCDMNLPLIKSDYSLDQFLHHYIKCKGWYLEQSSQFFEFKNVNFCGTMNASVKFSEYLLKYLNPVPYIQSNSDTKNNIFTILSRNELLHPWRENISKIMINLQEVVSREFQDKFKISLFNLNDFSDIALNLSLKISSYFLKTTEQQKTFKLPQQQKVYRFQDSQLDKIKKNKILQCWINETQKKYLQKFGCNYDKQKIFYFMNNVLMEQERTRYRNIVSSDQTFLSNLPYYMGRLQKDNRNTTRLNKLTKTSLTPTSYKFYQSLQQIKSDIQTIQTNLSKNVSLEQFQKDIPSLTDEIKDSLVNKQNISSAICYVKTMTSMIDYIEDDKGHLIFVINDQNKENSQVINDTSVNLNQSTIKQLFFSNTKNSTSTEIKPYNKLADLLQYVGRINNSQVLQYEQNKQLTDLRLDWKIFIYELFQLINSPNSSNLYDKFIVHIKNFTPSHEFILEQLIKLKRIGQFTLLQDFISTQDIQIDQTLQKQTLHMKEKLTSADNQRYSENFIQSQKELTENNRKKLIAQRKKQLDMLLRNNTAQIIRQKILRKIKFVFCIDQDLVQKLKTTYSIIFQKSHILWNSQLNIQGFKLSQQQSISSKQLGQKNKQAVQSTKPIDEQKKNKTNTRQLMIQAYLKQQQCFNHYLTFKNFKQVYSNILSQVLSKDDMKKRLMEIDDCVDGEFLYFLKFFNSLKSGIESKVNRKIEKIDKQYIYLQSLSNQFLPELNQIILTKKLYISQKDKQLQFLTSSIESQTLEKQKFSNYFAKSQQCITFLEKQSKQANQLYNGCIQWESSSFVDAQTVLIELLKSGKQKKVILTNEMKMYLEMLGVVVNKKLKPEENMIKELIKDINSLKIHKKISNLVVEIPLEQKINDKIFIISEKASIKLKQFISKNLQQQFNKAAERKESKEQKQLEYVKIKELSFSEGLLYMLKQYFIRLSIYSLKSQSQAIKQLNKKCAKCLKQLSKTRQQYSKSQKSKQFEKITTQLLSNKKNKQLIQESYDIEKKLLQKLLKIQKLSIQILCLNIRGEVDQKQLASREIYMQEFTENILNERNMNIVVQKIKQHYLLSKDQLKAINNAKDILAFMFALKLHFHNQSISESLLHKSLSKQTLEAFKLIKISCWEELCQDMQPKVKVQNMQHQQIEFFQYLQKNFQQIKIVQYLEGLVIMQKNSQIENWILKYKNKTIIKYDNCAFDKLNNLILQSQTLKILSGNIRIQTNIQDTDELIILQIKSLNQIQSFRASLLTEITRTVLQYFSKQKMIILCEKSIIQQLKNSLISLKQQINFCCLNWKGQKTRLAYKMQSRFEQQLCQQKKQSEIKTLSKFKQLKQSQKQNFVERKQIIKNFDFVNSLRNVFVDNKSEVGKQITLNSTKINFLQTTDIHLGQLKQNLLEYTSINLNLEALPNVINIKKRGNAHATKLIKYIIRVFQGIKALQQEQIILPVNTCQKFSQFVLWIIQKEKEVQKSQTSQNKLFKSIKNKIFEHFSSINDVQKLQIGLVFALAGQDTLTDNEHQKIIKLIIRLYKYSQKLLLTDLKLKNQIKQQSQGLNVVVEPEKSDEHYLIKNFVLQKSVKKIDHHSDHITNFKASMNYEKKQYFKLSQQFQSFLDMLSETFLSFKDLKHSFKKKIDIWIGFLQTIQSKFGENLINTLPEPYNDINRSYFGIFIALTRPQVIQDWINTHLAEEDLVSMDSLNTFSNESIILKMSKLNYKQTILIGDNSISKLYELASRTRKQIKLYSKLQIQKRKSIKGHESTSLKSSPNSTKKQINLNQLSFLNNRKFQQQFVEELYQCMKNSAWLVIDVQNLRSSTSNQNSFEVDTTKLDTIVKLIDYYTGEHKEEQFEDQGSQQQQQQTTHHMISETSQKNFTLPKSTKNEFSGSSFDNCDYQIFFVFPKQMQNFALKNNISTNYGRCILQVNQHNQIQRWLQLPKFFYEQVTKSKKVVKDFESLDINIKHIIYHAIECLKDTLRKVIQVGRQNSCFVKNLENKFLVNFKKIQGITSVIVKLILNTILEPQMLTEILITRQISLLKNDSAEEQKQDDQKYIKVKNQPKINSRFHKEKVETKKESINSNLSKKQIVLQNEKIASKQKITKNQPNNLAKYYKVVQIVKLFQAYIQATFNDKQLSVTGIRNQWENYRQSQLIQLQNKEKNADNKSQKKIKIKNLLTGDTNKTFASSSKLVLENILTFVQENNSHLQKKTQKNKYLTQSSLVSSSSLDSLKDIKLFLQRLMRLNPDIISSQNFQQKIILLIQLKKTSEHQFLILKKLYAKNETKQNLAQNFNQGQFNFSTLTQGLNIQQMRKKLNLTKKTTINDQSTIIQKSMAEQKIHSWLLKRLQRFIKLIQNKITLLKSFKQIFLLQKINYELLHEFWSKQKKQNTMNESLVLLCNFAHKSYESQFNKQKELFEYFRNPQNIDIGNYKKTGLKVQNLVLSLISFGQSGSLQQFIYTTKQFFCQINKLKPPNIKHHFIIEDNNDQAITKRNKNQESTLYKICSFDGFSFYNCQRGKKLAVKNKLMFMLDSELGFSRNTENTKVSLYFEEIDQQSDFESSSSSSSDDDQNSEEKQQNICFYLNKMTYPQSQSLKNQNNSFIQIPIQVERNIKKDLTSVNAFIYF